MSAAFARMETSVTSLFEKSKILLSLYTFSNISVVASALSAQILTLFSETSTSVISYCFMAASPLSYRSMPLSRTHSFVLKSAPRKWSASGCRSSFPLQSVPLPQSSTLSLGTVICSIYVIVTSYVFIAHGSFLCFSLPSL